MEIETCIINVTVNATTLDLRNLSAGTAIVNDPEAGTGLAAFMTIVKLF